MKIATHILWLFVLVGCATSSIPENTVQMDTGHESVSKAAVAKLQKEGDWYQILNSTTLRVAYPPPDYLIPTIEHATSLILPKERSSSFPEKMLIKITDRLKPENTPYKIVYFDGGPWLVWEAKDSEAVSGVISEISSSMNIKSISEDDFRYKLH